MRERKVNDHGGLKGDQTSSWHDGQREKRLARGHKSMLMAVGQWVVHGRGSQSSGKR